MVYTSNFKNPIPVDIMNTKQVGALAVVVVVLIAGVSVYLAMGGGRDPSSPNYGLSENIDGRLTIFGNANNDDYIDQRDVEAVQAIIDGEEEAVYFDCTLTYGGQTVQMTLADANADGVVDETDLDIIQRMVNREEGMTVYFYDVDGVVSHCTYPLTTLAIGYKSNYEAVLICDAVDSCLYACDQVADGGAYSQWYTMFSSAQSIGSRFTPDYEVFTQGSNEPPSAFLTGTRAWFDADMETTLAPLGVDVVRLPFWEDNVTVSGIITLGYLLDCEEAAYEYAEIADSVLLTIEEALEDIPLEDRPLVYASYSGTSISTLHNGVHEFVWACGGKTVLDIGGYQSGASIDGEGLVDMNPDFIVFSVYYGFLEEYDTLESTKEYVYDMLMNTDGRYLSVAEMTEAYQNGNVYIMDQGMFMGPASYIPIAYMANILYPDLFDFDVDALFAEYLERYHPEYSIEDFEGLAYYTMQDVLDYYA